ANFNSVLARADGDYFMWAAHDDRYEPSFVERMVELHAGHPGAAIAFCVPDQLDTGGVVRRYRQFDYACLAELGGAAPPRARLERLLWYPERHGKALLIYGLMPRPLAQRAGKCVQYSTNRVGLDHLAVFRLVAHGDVHVWPERLFHKRLIPWTPLAPTAPWP